MLVQLRELRESNERDSPRVARLCTQVLKNASAAGSEIWLVYEQAFIAAVDTGDAPLQIQAWDSLCARFGHGSSRLQRLAALAAQSTAEFVVTRWMAARAILLPLATASPANTAVQKQLVALHLAMEAGSPTAALSIKALRDYLLTNMTDSEAWLALAQTYLKGQMFAYAAFCFEELILSNPHNYAYHLVLAETLYTQGHVERARNHFAQAVQLNAGSARALWGLFHSHCCSKSANKDLKAATETALLKLYVGKPNAAAVTKYLAVA